MTNRARIAVLQENIAGLRAVIDVHLQSRERMREIDQQALDLASADVNRRLEGMNNFRAQIKEAEAQFLSRPEFQGKFDILEQRLRTIEDTATALNNSSLGQEFSKGIDQRFRSIERLIWSASGGVAIIVFILQWLRPPH
jgi:hypothetical protein